MQIDELAQRTGLSKETVYFYQSKGLLAVNNDTNYSENDLHTLKLIKLLAYLDFTIDEIERLIHSEETFIQDAIRHKLSDLEVQKDKLADKKSIYKELLKDFRKKKLSELVDVYINIIDLYEDPNLFGNKADNTHTYTSIGSMILKTLVLIAPILWLFVNYANERYIELKYNIPIALISVALLTFAWTQYFHNFRSNPKMQKLANKGSWFLLPSIIIPIVLVFPILAFFEKIQIKLFSVDGWLFYQMPELNTVLLALFVVIASFLILTALFRRFLNNTIFDISMLLKYIKKLWIPTALIYLFIFYFSLTGVTFVSDNKITFRDWLHPTGVVYDYSDVIKVETGYSGKQFSLLEGKGTFYYKIYFKDNKCVNISSTIPNSDIKKYADDTYLEIEEFDRSLMMYHPEKIGSKKYSEYADLDQVYVDRFNRIIDRR